MNYYLTCATIYSGTKLTCIELAVWHRAEQSTKKSKFYHIYVFIFLLLLGIYSFLVTISSNVLFPYAQGQTHVRTNCLWMQLWHALAKMSSEKAAWALAMDRRLNMVSINPGLIVGPSVAHHNPRPTMSYLKGTSIFFLSFFKGSRIHH